MSHSARKTISESHLILIVGLIQFINILDFMMVMPLGPDFAIALGIPAENIGIIGGSYTLAAAVSGLIASLFLDSFDRKKALLVMLIGLAFATGMGALSWNLHTLLAARVLAGAFGGPLSSLSIAMIADFIPPERRGAAMGKVSGAFAAASVLGVPFGLELAQRLGWRTPFIWLCGIALLVWLLAFYWLPARSNLRESAHIRLRASRLLKHFSKPMALSAFGYTSLAMMASFMIVPNISAHLQMNMNYPRAHLGLLYFSGGTISFFSMRAVGKLVDKTSATLISTLAAVLYMLALCLGFIWYHHHIPVVLIFIFFMIGSSSRNVCAQTLSSKVPPPAERGGFMSLISVMIHLGSAAGAFISSQMLTHRHGRLEGIEHVGIASIALSCFVPFLFYITEKHIRPGKALREPLTIDVEV